jgi:prophage antirepressor-like protein
MDIIKAFTDNEFSMSITIKGTREEPLFRASDIGEILGLTNIRMNIQDYDATEKCGISLIDAIGRSQETTFLTEKGLYELLFRSNKPIAKTFKNWVFDIIKEIRLNAISEYQKQLVHYTNEIQDKDKQLKLKNKESREKDNQLLIKSQENEKNLIDNSVNEPCVYIGITESHEIVIDGIKITIITEAKWGSAKDSRTRIQTHKKEIGKHFTLKYIVKSHLYIKLEDLIKKEFKTKGTLLYGRRTEKVYKGKNQTELVKFDETFTIDDFYDEVKRLKEVCETDYIKKIDKENIKLRSEVYDFRQANEARKYNARLEQEQEEEDKQEEQVQIVEDEEEDETIDLIKCSTCSTKAEIDKFGINPVTNQCYTQCLECRDKYSKERLAKNEKKRLEDEKLTKEKNDIIKMNREKLLAQQIIIKCFSCRLNKSPIDMGVSKILNQLHKTCTVCRDKAIATKKENEEKAKKEKAEQEGEEEVEEEEQEEEEEVEKTQECTHCHHAFELEYDDIKKTIYKTCKPCRERDVEVRKKLREAAKNASEMVICTGCNQSVKKELNVKGFLYKKCKICRDKRKKYDKKKNEVHHEAILEQKKEYYAENKDRIRAEQKEYYNTNRDTILASKAHKPKTEEEEEEE